MHTHKLCSSSSISSSSSSCSMDDNASAVMACTKSTASISTNLYGGAISRETGKLRNQDPEQHTCHKFAKEERRRCHSSEHSLPAFWRHRHAVVIPPWGPNGLPKGQLNHKQHGRPLYRAAHSCCKLGTKLLGSSALHLMSTTGKE